MSQGNPVKFEATPTLTNNTVSWKLCLTNPPKPSPTAPTPPPVCGDGSATSPYPDVVLDPNILNYVLKFRIVNEPPGTDFRFANPALVIKSGNPTGTDSQIDPPGAAQKVLTIVDKNTLPSLAKPAPVKISYGLNFTNNGQPVTSIDPDITNGGTNRFTWADYLLPVAVAFAAGIVFMLLLRKITKGDFW